MATVRGNRIASGLLDRYLARTGVDSQQTAELTGPREGNLVAVLPGDPGCHGGFDDEAHARSPGYLATHGRGGVVAAVAGAVAAGSLLRVLTR